MLFRSQSATKVTTHRTGADDKDPHGGMFLVDGRLLIVGRSRLRVRTGSLYGESNEFVVQLFCR